MSKPSILVSKRNLKALVNQLHFALSQGLTQADRNVQQLIKSIRYLLGSLNGYMKSRELRRILGATAFLFGLGFSTQLAAQSFAPAVSSPAGLPTNLDVSIPTFGDLDGDGDFDMLTGELDFSGYYYSGSLYYYENTEGGHGGSSTNDQLAYSLALDYTHLWSQLK